MLKKIVASFATLLLAAGLSVVAIAAPASATAYPPTGSSANQPDNWEVLTGEECIKIEPVNTVPYPLPSPGEGRTFSKVIVKAGSGDDANYVISSGLAQGTLVQHNIKNSISHLILCTVPTPFDWNWTYAAPTCDALTVVYPGNIPSGQANDVNVRIQYGANYSQEVTLNFHNNNGTWSGTKTFTYSSHANWPANIGPYKVVWTQVGGTNYHWQGEVSCGSTPKDATATVNTTPATCSAAETFVDVTVVNATYVVTYPTASTYKVTATAAAGHLFADGTNKLIINGTLASQLTEGCAELPKCLPKSAVTYTYFPATNNGVITVVNPNPAKYTNDLCDPFWVTATSWNYTTSGVWPQTLKENNPLPKITGVGVYNYAASVGCGQGDIYASFTGEPYVGPELFGPNNPFTEKFLHNMGFAGPQPTYMQTATGCNDAPVTVPTAQAITECGTYGSVSVPADTTKIDYTLTGNGTSGINTVTAVAIAPYVLKNYPAGGWSFDLKSYTDCERTLTLTYVPSCAPDETNDWKVFNPGAENLEVTYPGGTVTAVAGQYTAISTPASDDAFTISWGATGSGIKPGEATATPGADLPADDPACIKLAEPVKPTLTKVTECGVYGSVVAAETTGVVYDVTFDKETGDYKVVATPAFGYYFAGDVEEVVYEGTVGAYYECVEEPDASVAYGECVYNEDGTADQRHVWITFDNTGSNKPVFFEVPYFSEYNQTVPAGEKVTFQVSDIWPAGGGYQVKAAGETFELEIPACDLPTLPLPITRDEVLSSYNCDTAVATVTTTTYTTNWIFDTEAVEWVKLPEVASEPVITTRPMTEEEIGEQPCLVAVTDPEASTCLSDTEATDLTSWIRVALDSKVEYRIDGVLVTTEYTAVTPGVHTVTADALGGYTLSGGNPDAWTDTHHEWTYTAVDSSLECDPPTLANVTPEFSYTPLTCTAAGSYTLGELAEGTVAWTVNGKTVGVGTYPVTSAQTLTFVASPVSESDSLDPEWVQPQPIEFSQGAAPCDLVTLALTGATNSFGLIWVAMLLGLTGVGFVLIRRRTAIEK